MTALTAQAFDEYAETALHFDGPFRFPEACRDAMLLGSGTYIDVGAGDGAVIRSAHEQGLLANFSRAIALDVSPLRIARIRSAPFPGLEPVVGEAGAVPLPSHSVDLAFSHQVIEHVPDDAQMAREIARILRPGGQAFVTSVVKRWYGWYFYRCNGKWTLDPTHVREYASGAQFLKLFEDAGLRIVSYKEPQAAHPLDKVAIWSLVRTNLVALERARSLYDRPAMRLLGRLAILIPGYRICEVLVTLPAP